MEQVQVRLRCGRATDQGTQEPGEVITVGSAEAEALIANGSAEPLEEADNAGAAGGGAGEGSGGLGLGDGGRKSGKVDGK
jgi:hypothetical protein